jgi:hypothetical protein
MKFLVLLTEVDHFDAWDAISDEGRRQAIDAYNAFVDAVRERGAILAGDALHRPEEARTLQPGPERTVTDGPYAETKEQLGGFYYVELPDLETAVELAGLLPREYTIEVRPALDIEV